MLCTPPAFILSQDQTLEIIVSKRRSLCDLIFLLSSLALSFFYFLLSSILICKNFPRSVSSFSLCTSLLLFNFQWSVFVSLSRDLVIIPHRSAFVNTFFETFLKSFLRLAFAQLWAILLPPSLGEPVYYTTSLASCQELFLLFSPFFTFLALQTVFIRHFVRLFGRLVCKFPKRFGGGL